MKPESNSYQHLWRTLPKFSCCSAPFEPRGSIFAIMAIVVAFACVGCREEKPVSAKPLPPDRVAQVGDLVISSDELTEALMRRSKSLGGGGGSELRQQVLDELIREKTLLTQARAAGVDRDPELIRRWERMVVAKYEAAHKPEADKQRAPTSTEVEHFYREHSAEYQRPERIHVALIQVKGSAKATEEKRAELRDRAQKILSLARGPGADFANIAQLHSEDRATRYSGGDAGWIEPGQTPPSWPKELAEAAFRLSTPDEVGPLVEAGGSFYVLKLLGRQAAGLRPLAEVRDRIAYKLKEQQRIANEERFYADQRVGVTVRINQAALQAVPLPAPVVVKNTGNPPSLPSN